MHSSDNQLQLLLTADETTGQLQAISAHVEQCTRCQQRLQQLSGEGPWTSEMLERLRKPQAADVTSSFDANTSGQYPRRTLVLQHPSDALEDDVELDPVSLDFLEEPSHPELLGKLGRYEIESVIGAGGMGVVLKGFDSDLHRPVAIKVLAPHLAHSAAARKRFAREAQAIAAVIHPHVIPIYNVEVDQKLPYLVMSLIDGPSLQSYVDTHGPLPIDVALRIAAQTVVGLSAAHAQGLIHRDVKPANILLDGSMLRVVLSDFGLARMVDDASMTRTGIVTGTPHYMSPEQAGGDAIDCRSDLFSLGCVLWFMLTGRPPFCAATAMGVLNKICHTSAGDIRQLNPQVPIPLAKIIERLLSKSASDRYQSATELQRDLNQLLMDWQSGKLARKPARKRTRVLVSSALLIAAILGSATVAIYWSWDRTVENTSTSLRPFPGQPTSTTSSTSNDPTVLHTLRSDQWHKDLARLSQDIAQLENSDSGARATWQLLDRVNQHAQEEFKQIEATLNTLEKDSVRWREIISGQ